MSTENTTLADEDLLRIARRLQESTMFIQGFSYPPHHVIRDLRKPSVDQVIWREREEEAQAFSDQMVIERMRFAMEADDVR